MMNGTENNKISSTFAAPTAQHGQKGVSEMIQPLVSFTPSSSTIYFEGHGGDVFTPVVSGEFVNHECAVYHVGTNGKVQREVSSMTAAQKRHAYFILDDAMVKRTFTK